MSFGLDLVIRKCHLGVSYDHGFRENNAKTYTDVEDFVIETFGNPIKNHSLYFTVGFDF